MIEAHYIENRQKFVKNMTFRSGSPEAAEDIVQEAYYRALKYKDTCDPERFHKWFNMILYNTLRDYKREESGRIEEEFEEEFAEGFPCSHYTDQVLREINVLIEGKGEAHKEILSLHFQQNYSPKDISQITEYSYAMCSKVIERFRNELRDIYK